MTTAQTTTTKLATATRGNRHYVRLGKDTVSQPVGTLDAQPMTVTLDEDTGRYWLESTHEASRYEERIPRAKKGERRIESKSLRAQVDRNGHVDSWTVGNKSHEVEWLSIYDTATGELVID